MAQWMIGETHFHQKDYQAAVAAYLRVHILFAYPRWQAASLLQAGKCQELLREFDKARSLYEEALDELPESPFHAELRTRLSALQQRLVLQTKPNQRR